MRKLQLLASAFALAAVAPQAAIAAGPVLDPSVQKFVDGLAGGKPIYDFSPADARKVLVGLQLVPKVMPAVQTEDRVLPLGPKGSTKIRVIRPKGVTGTLPVNVYFHGAGWVMGDTQTHDRLVRELSAVRGDGDGSALRNWLVSMAAAAFVCAIAADAIGDAAAYMAESSEIRPRLAFTKRICSAVGPGMMLRMSFLGLATHRSMLPRLGQPVAGALAQSLQLPESARLSAGTRGTGALVSVPIDHSRSSSAHQVAAYGTQLNYTQV